MASDLKKYSEHDMLAAIEQAFSQDVADKENGEEFDYSVLGEYVMWGDWNGELTSLGWSLKYVDNYGGEGYGDLYWYVFTVTDGNTTRHVKVDGAYASYYGGEYDKWFEVFPKEKVITVWEQ